MRWTLKVVLFLLRGLGFEVVEVERVSPDGKNRAWVIKVKRDGKEYEGFGITAKTAFEDIIGKWLKEVRI